MFISAWGTFWRHFPMTNINQSTWCYVPSLVDFWEGSFKCIKCIPQTHNCIGGRSISCSFIHLYQSKGESFIIFGVFTDKFILTDYISYLPKIRFFLSLIFFLSIKYKGKQTIDYCFIILYARKKMVWKVNNLKGIYIQYIYMVYYVNQSF